MPRKRLTRTQVPKPAAAASPRTNTRRKQIAEPDDDDVKAQEETLEIVDADEKPQNTTKRNTRRKQTAEPDGIQQEQEDETTSLEATADPKPQVSPRKSSRRKITTPNEDLPLQETKSSPRTSTRRKATEPDEDHQDHYETTSLENITTDEKPQSTPKRSSRRKQTTEPDEDHQEQDETTSHETIIVDEKPQSTPKRSSRRKQATEPDEDHQEQDEATSHETVLADEKPQNTQLRNSRKRATAHEGLQVQEKASSIENTAIADVSPQNKIRKSARGKQTSLPVEAEIQLQDETSAIEDKATEEKSNARTSPRKRPEILSSEEPKSKENSSCAKDTIIDEKTPPTPAQKTARGRSSNNQSVREIPVRRSNIQRKEVEKQERDEESLEMQTNGIEGCELETETAVADDFDVTMQDVSKLAESVEDTIESTKDAERETTTCEKTRSQNLDSDDESLVSGMEVNLDYDDENLIVDEEVKIDETVDHSAENVHVTEEETSLNNEDEKMETDEISDHITTDVEKEASLSPHPVSEEPANSELESEELCYETLDQKDDVPDEDDDDGNDDDVSSLGAGELLILDEEDAEYLSLFDNEEEANKSKSSTTLQDKKLMSAQIEKGKVCKDDEAKENLQKEKEQKIIGKDNKDKKSSTHADKDKSISSQRDRGRKRSPHSDKDKRVISRSDKDRRASPRSSRDRRRTSPRNDRDKRRTSPHSDKDKRKTSPHSDKDKRKISPHSDKDKRRASPRNDRDKRKISPRSDRDKRRTSLDRDRKKSPSEARDWKKSSRDDKARRNDSHDSRDRRRSSHDEKDKNRSKDAKVSQVQNKSSTETHGKSSGNSKPQPVLDISGKESQNFHKIVIVANSLYGHVLRRFETSLIKLILDDNLNSKTLVDMVRKHKNKMGQKTLWVLVSGIHSLMESENHGCRVCKKPLHKIKLFDEFLYSEQETKDEIKNILHLANMLCVEVQKELGNDGIITMIPPMPTALVQAESFKHHKELHKVAQQNEAPVTSQSTIMRVGKIYDMFCNAWTNLACDRMQYWMNTAVLQKFKDENPGKNFVPITNKDNYAYVPKRWSDALRVFFNIVLHMPFPKQIISDPLKLLNEEYSDSSDQEDRFHQVVILGNTQFTKTLQEDTSKLAVVHMDENLDFDEDGLTFLKEQQKKWPSKTLWVVLSGVSEVAEPVVEGPPKCIKSSCTEPIPTFVTKNHALGDPDYKNASIDSLVNSVIKQAFDFATLASEHLGDGSALFLAPIMPLRAIWAGSSSSHTHDGLHRMFKRDASVPFFIGGSSEWINCARSLENKWLDKIVTNLPEDSEPLKLMKRYIEEREPVLAYIEDVSEANSKNPRKSWSALMVGLLKHFLGKDTEPVPAQQVVVEPPIPEPQSAVTAVNIYNTELEFGPPGETRPEPQPVPVDIAYMEGPLMYPYQQGPPMPPYSASHTPGFPGPHPMGPPVLAPPVAYPVPPQPGYMHGPPGDPMHGLPGGPLPAYPVGQPVSDSWQTGWTSSSWQPLPTAVEQQQQSSTISKAPLPATSVEQVPLASAPTTTSYTIQAPPKLNETMKGHLIIQNVDTDMDQTQAKELLRAFGELEDMKWPLKQNDQPAQFIMANYANRKHAESAERILNYLKVFGDNSEVKLIGSNKRGDTSKLESEDLELLLSIHDALERIKKKSKKNKSAKKNLEKAAIPLKVEQPAKQSASSIGPSRVAPQVVLQENRRQTSGLSVSQNNKVSHQAAPQKTLTPQEEACQENRIRQQGTLAGLSRLEPYKPFKLEIRSDKKVSEPAIIKSIPLPKQEKVIHTVRVRDFTDLVPIDTINEMFMSLGATEPGVLRDNSLHFTFEGSVAELRLLFSFRFPDKKMKLDIKGPEKDKPLLPEEVRSAKLKVDAATSKVLYLIGRDLKAEVDNDVNVYTFKTRLCKFGDRCQSKACCHCYHNKEDRRRCPVIFKYRDDSCPQMEVTGACDVKDRCPQAHSPVERLFHFYRYRSSVCLGMITNGSCDKVGRICSSVHPGEPEMMYNDKWENVYLEGLGKMTSYLSAAIRNLFLFPDLNCLRVLLITPSPEMAKLYVNSVSDLAVSCNQKIVELTGKENIERATIVVATLEAVMPLLLSSHRGSQGKKLYSSRLKALLIDDGPSIFKDLSQTKREAIKNLAKSRDVNVVITTPKRDDKAVADARDIFKHPFALDVVSLDKFKTSTVARRPSPRMGTYKDDLPPSLFSERSDMLSSSSSRSERRDNSSASHSDRRDLPSSSSRSEKRDNYSTSHSDRRDLSSSSSRADKWDDSSLSRADKWDNSSLSHSDRMDMSSSQSGGLDLPMSSYQEKQDNFSSLQSERKNFPMSSYSETSSQQLPYQGSRDQLQASTSSKMRNTDHSHNDKPVVNLQVKLEAAVKELDTEQNRELKLYLEMPELHPEYEQKYGVFMDQYQQQFPGRHDLKHSEKLWKVFWRELVTGLLKDEYDKKRKILEKEFAGQQQSTQQERFMNPQQSTQQELFMNPHQNKQQGNSIAPTKRKATDDGYDRQEKYMKGNGHQGGMVQSDVSVADVLTLLEDVSPCIGILGPAVQLLVQKIRSNWSDTKEIIKLLEDEDNEMILKLVTEKAKTLSKSPDSGQYALKLQLVSIHASKLLDYVNSTTSSEKVHGLDISKVARATFNKDPAYIVQFIKNALLFENITNVTNDDITDIYVAVTSAHFSLAFPKPEDSSSSQFGGTGLEQSSRNTREYDSPTMQSQSYQSKGWNSRDDSNDYDDMSTQRQNYQDKNTSNSQEYNDHYMQNQDYFPRGRNSNRNNADFQSRGRQNVGSNNSNNWNDFGNKNGNNRQKDQGGASGSDGPSLLEFLSRF